MGRHGVYTTTAQTIHTYDDIHACMVHTHTERNNKHKKISEPTDNQNILKMW
jgi:hypothetical protein